MVGRSALNPLLSRADLCESVRLNECVVVAPRVLPADSARACGDRARAGVVRGRHGAPDMGSSHPDAVGMMLAHAASMFVVGLDGAARSASSGKD